MALGSVMLDVDGLVLSSEDVALLQDPAVGGVIYFARNFESPEQISELSASIRAIRPELLIAVDQEGGRVQRFKEGFTRLPAMQQFLPLYRKNPAAALRIVTDCGWLMASELLAVGVDFSFAPVLDLDDCRCNVIANRAFSPDPQEAIHLASAWMKGMHDAGMATTGKHFPGHGSVTVDSHVELPIDQREFSVIAAHDLLPFAALISQLDAVMPAHILFSVVDSKQPVGFSEYWLKTILRCDLGFTGVIFSDDLSMAGAAVGGSFAERAALALDAGCDMVLVCNNRAGAIEVVAGVGCGSPKSQNRLLSMRAREQVSWDHLKSNPRWQLSAHLLAGIIGDH